MGSRGGGSPSRWGGFGESHGEEGAHHHESIVKAMGPVTALLPVTQGFSELWCSPLVQKLLIFVFSQFYLFLLVMLRQPGPNLNSVLVRQGAGPLKAQTVIDYNTSKIRSIRPDNILQTFFHTLFKFPWSIKRKPEDLSEPCLQGWRIRSEGSTVAASPAHGIAARRSPAVFHTLHPHGTAQR